MGAGEAESRRFANFMGTMRHFSVRSQSQRGFQPIPGCCHSSFHLTLHPNAGFSGYICRGLPGTDQASENILPKRTARQGIGWDVEENLWPNAEERVD